MTDVDALTSVPAACKAVDRYAGPPLAGGPSGPAEVRELFEVVVAALVDGGCDRGGPIPPGDPAELTREVQRVLGDVLPEHGAGVSVLGPLARMFARGAADLADPAWAAHLLCPPLALAVAADVTATALNADLASWDQTPAGIVLEGEIMSALVRLVGFDSASAAGVITSGGTESNFMGLLLARDAAAPQYSGAAGEFGCGGGRLRIFASRLAHFSIQRNAALLGLGASAVVPVDVDDHYRMDPLALREALKRTVTARVVRDEGLVDGEGPHVEDACAVERAGQVLRHRGVRDGERARVVDAAAANWEGGGGAVPVLDSQRVQSCLGAYGDDSARPVAV